MEWGQGTYSGPGRRPSARVLSPVLYCIFIHCFLAEKPKDTPAPEYAHAAVDLLYSQGLQDDPESGEGVFSAALGRWVRAMLYIDDTTLVAKAKGGLKSLTEKYMRFCRKFWMRLNHKKSKVMHYRTVFGAVGEPEDAGYEAGGPWVRFEQPSAPTTGPGIGRRQPYLGFLTDEALSGKAHYNKALAMGHAQAGKVGDISAKMGEDMGLMYLFT